MNVLESAPRPASAHRPPAPLGERVLRRACACGGAPGPDGECAACRKKRLQRLAASPAPAPSVAPPIVHDVLRSSGRPLDEGVRSEMEPRFGHSFADVRVHADGRAAESARAVDAAAYTVGRRVVFGAGRYTPGSEAGRRLIAHELAHVVQQSASAAATGAALEIGAVDDPAEAEAERAAARATSGASADGTAAALRRSPLSVQRAYELDVTPATRFDTAQGTFYRFPADPHHSNHVNRPQFRHEKNELIDYTGAGAVGEQRVHGAVHGALDTLMKDMHAEGARIGDQSLSGATVESPYRPPEASEGAAYLKSLRITIAENRDVFGTLAFPTALQRMAQSELGFSGSPAHNRFRDAVGAQPGWTPALARRLVDITRDFKAPRGGSTHHSGVVADIGWRFATSATAVAAHGTQRARNADAFQAAAGVWLNRFAAAHGFDTYNTRKEIWHQEWREWRGTPADPSYVAPPPPPAAKRMPQGMTDYRRDTEMTTCVRIHGNDSYDYCERAVGQALESGGAPTAPEFP